MPGPYSGRGSWERSRDKERDREHRMVPSQTSLAIVKLMSSLAGVKRETKAQSRNTTSYLMLTVRSQAGAAGIGMQTGKRKKRAPTSGSSVGMQEQGLMCGLLGCTFWY